MLYRPRTSNELYCNVIIFPFKLNNLPAYLIGHSRNERATGAEMRSAIVSGIVTRNVPVSYWLIFSPVHSNSPGSLSFLMRQKQPVTFTGKLRLKSFLATLRRRRVNRRKRRLDYQALFEKEPRKLF